MKERIWLSPPYLTGKEQEFVKDAFDSNWIAPFGPHVDAFEQELCAYTGAPYAAALSSGTAAIHLALILLGVKQNDYVICSSFTFSASANPIIYQGAIPVFVDCERDTWNMDPQLLKDGIASCKKQGKKPKAIILVHLYGMPAKLDEIMAIANDENIPVIEDAAEALGSEYNSRHAGTFGKFGVLSFNGNKIITSSGGGALISNDGKLIEKARFLATQARDKAPHYQHSEIGYNYRMSNICAAIGRGQLSTIGERVAKRKETFNHYQSVLSTHAGFSFLPEPANSFCNRWLTCMQIDFEKAGITRHEIQDALEKENIESRPLWKPMHLQPVFTKYPSFLNGLSENLFDSGLCLPSGTALSHEQRQHICSIILSLPKNK